MVVALQVTALGLINAAGKTGDVPTGVQFALKGQLSKTVSSSASLITQCWQERWRLTGIPCHRMRQTPASGACTQGRVMQRMME